MPGGIDYGCLIPKEVRKTNCKGAQGTCLQYWKLHGCMMVLHGYMVLVVTWLYAFFENA